MIKTFSSFLNTYKLYPVELTINDSYEILFKTREQAINVTFNTVLISLDKPTIAVKPGIKLIIENNFSLDIIKNKKLKANLKLKVLSLDAFTSNHSIYFFEVIKVTIEGRKFNEYPDLLFLILKNLTDKKTRNFKVSATSLISLFAFYIIPLPVYALCIGKMNEVDIFPNDILGNIHDGYYFFSVRTTNPSVKKNHQSKTGYALCSAIQ